MVWVIAAICVTLFVLWGYVTSSIILKMPRSSLDFNPKSFGYNFESFQVKTEDGIPIDCWWVPSKNKTKSTIVILHGWGANRSDVLPGTIFLAEKYHLAYLDFRNHGRSGGNVTSLTCLEIKDFVSVVKYLDKGKKNFVNQMGVLGFSMGGSVAISGSVQLPEIKAVVSESPFASYNATVIRFAKLFYGVPKFLIPVTIWFARLRLGFDPEACAPIHHIGQLSRPVLILQGGSDARMPVTEGQSLYDAAKEPKQLWIVPTADHGGVQAAAPEEYKKRILDFFEKWMKS